MNVTIKKELEKNKGPDPLDDYIQCLLLNISLIIAVKHGNQTLLSQPYLKVLGIIFFVFIVFSV